VWTDGWAKRKRNGELEPVIGCHRMGEMGEDDRERKVWVYE